MQERLLGVAMCLAILAPTSSYAESLTASAERIADAQAKQDAGPTTKREPVISFVLSLVFPGLGQLYNGPTEKTKGIVMLGVAGATIVMMAAGGAGDCEIDDDFEIDCGNDALTTVGAVGYLANAIYSMIDAPMSAGRINRERNLTFEVRPEMVGGQRGVRASIQWGVQF